MTDRSPLDIGKLAKDLRSGHRAALARAITLIESRRGDHRAAARDLVQALLPETGKAIRVGITGSPGVGKSTTIDGLGMFLIERGHKVAVLAVDPSSARTGRSTPRPVLALPCGSRSISNTPCPTAANAVARFIAVVVLPTPPF